LEAAETVHLELAELPFAEKPPEFRKAA